MLSDAIVFWKGGNPSFFHVIMSNGFTLIVKHHSYSIMKIKLDYDYSNTTYKVSTEKSIHMWLNYIVYLDCIYSVTFRNQQVRIIPSASEDIMF